MNDKESAALRLQKIMDRKYGGCLPEAASPQVGEVGDDDAKHLEIQQLTQTQQEPRHKGHHQHIKDIRVQGVKDSVKEQHIEEKFIDSIKNEEKSMDPIKVEEVVFDSQATKKLSNTLSVSKQDRRSFMASLIAKPKKMKPPSQTEVDLDK